MPTNFQDGDLIEVAHIKQYSGESYYGVSTGTATAYAVSVTPAPLTGYPPGMLINFRVHADCGANPTLSVNGFAAKNIVKSPTTTNLAANDLRLGQIVSLVYDQGNDRFHLLPSTSSGLEARGIQLVTTNAISVANGVNTVNAAWTGFTWRSESGYWTSGNAITIPPGLAGKYFVRAVVQYPAIPQSCVLSIQLDVNGIGNLLHTEQRVIPISGGANTILTVSSILNLASNDLVTFKTLQSSGSTVNTVASGTIIQAVRIGF
jgi:hypothetical protein